jgi:hypothetical protein
MSEEAPRAFSVREVAHRYKVNEDKVRAWIKRGELAAVNTSSIMCGKPQLRVLPEALAEFERRRAVAKPAPKRPRRCRDEIDFFPDY